VRGSVDISCGAPERGRGSTGAGSPARRRAGCAAGRAARARSRGAAPAGPRRRCARPARGPAGVGSAIRTRAWWFPPVKRWLRPERTHAIALRNAAWNSRLECRRLGGATPAPLGGAWMLLFGCWSSRRFLLPILTRLRNDEGDPVGRPRMSRYAARDLAIAPPSEGFREAEPDDAPARRPHPAGPRARCAGGG